MKDFFFSTFEYKKKKEIWKKNIEANASFEKENGVTVVMSNWMSSKISCMHKQKLALIARS